MHGRIRVHHRCHQKCGPEHELILQQPFASQQVQYFFDVLGKPEPGLGLKQRGSRACTLKSASVSGNSNHSGRSTGCPVRCGKQRNGLSK